MLVTWGTSTGKSTVIKYDKSVQGNIEILWMGKMGTETFEMGEQHAIQSYAFL